MNTHEQVVEILKTRGFSASYEYPGFVQVTLPAGNASFGDIDGFWTGELMDDDGIVLHTYDLGLLTADIKNPTAIQIADKIAQVIT